MSVCSYFGGLAHEFTAELLNLPAAWLLMWLPTLSRKTLSKSDVTQSHRWIELAFLTMGRAPVLTSEWNCACLAHCFKTCKQN